jgi:hypothetical protein
MQPVDYSLGIIYGYSHAVQPFDEGLDGMSQKYVDDSGR